MYRLVFSQVLRRLDAEAVHHRTVRALALLARLPLLKRPLHRALAPHDPALRVSAFGVHFPGPLGLAAGFDKDAACAEGVAALGFAHVEVGTVTAHAQPGNPRPRLFRLMPQRAIVNRMGFNNEGAAALAARLKALRRPLGVPLGISLGKSKVTPLDEAVEDYLASYRALRGHGDYFAVNVSSPNTPGLRSLQDRGHLDALLGALVGEKPVLVKIAPDLTEAAIAELLEVCLARGAAGVIATNTTLSRDGLAGVDVERGAQAGGLSGRPLTGRARDVVAFVHSETGGRLPIVGVGGVLDPDDAARMFDAGAALVQLYTGFIYRGPALVRAAARAAAATAAPDAVAGR